jgi:hypothetical protein
MHATHSGEPEGKNPSICFLAILNYADDNEKLRRSPSTVLIAL